MPAIDTRVINLARRQDRLASISGSLDDAGIAWSRHAATDATLVDPAALSARIPGTSHAYPMAHVERACAASHIQAWTDFMAGQARALCILEDDVRFAPDLADLLASDAWVTAGHGVLKLDANSARTRRSLVCATTLRCPAPGQLFRLWSRRLGAGGYLAHRDVIGRLLDLHARPRAPIDHCLFNPPYAPQFRDPGVCIVEPPLVFHDHTGSDLQDTRQRATQSRGRISQKIAREAVGLGAIPARLQAMATFGARFRSFPD